MAPIVDWSVAWLHPFGSFEAGGLLIQRSEPSIADALNGRELSGIRFVPHRTLTPGMPYERFIAETGQVPTRDNLHDFFNGLVWHRYPLAKARLNRVQAEAIAADGIGGRRGPVRDAATVFDENGAVFTGPDVLWQALSARDWQALFVTHRAAWAGARLELFGHALLEKLVSPRKGITAHVLRRPIATEKIAEGSGGSAADTDAWLAGHLTAARLAAKPFVPLPVLGVPGWWPANEASAFYDDPRVFRPARAPADG
ncbi:DUF3025 domain-containing protein [Sphingomonas sp. NCPPB 2930]